MKIFMKARSNNMKKYTLKNYKEFCKEAFIVPPAENFEEWISNHNICITANGCEIELDYSPDAIQELEYTLKELYKIYYGIDKENIK